jgi:hypothetical protein
VPQEKLDEFLKVLVGRLLVIHLRVFQMACLICDLIFGMVSGFIYFSYSGLPNFASHKLVGLLTLYRRIFSSGHLSPAIALRSHCAPLSSNAHKQLN